MTPEEAKRAEAKLTRYGHSFERDIDQCLPADLVKTKAGKIAKRQPKYQTRNKNYYKAQCSFRGLKTTGTTEELQQLLKSRDLAKDSQIQGEMDDIEEQLDAHREEQEDLEDERWWADPARTLDEKAGFNAIRAVQENLENGGILKEGCHVFKRYCHSLKQAAFYWGLAYQAIERPPAEYMPRGFSIAVCQVAGQEAAVKETAGKIQALADKEHREAEAKRQEEKARMKAAAKAKHQALLQEAVQMPDWDITGTWKVECRKMAEFTGGSSRPEKLSMEIWRDDFSLEDIRGDGDEDDESDEEYYYGYPYYEADRPAPKPKPKSTENDKNIPRFQASFNFNIIEGTMRLYPPISSRPQTGPFILKQNPWLEYIWRGRETGEGEIQMEALKYEPDTVTFGDHGTTFKGKFNCPYIKGLVEIEGTKREHGRGREMSSKAEWRELSEKAWNRASVTRWGGGW